MTRTPKLSEWLANAPNALGIVLRSCVTRTRWRLAAISNTSRSLLPESFASSEVWKSTRDSRRRTPSTIRRSKFTSARNLTLISCGNADYVELRPTFGTAADVFCAHPGAASLNHYRHPLGTRRFLPDSPDRM